MEPISQEHLLTSLQESHVAFMQKIAGLEEQQEKLLTEYENMLKEARLTEVRNRLISRHG